MALQTESPTVNRAEAGSIKFARKESIMPETEEKVDGLTEETTEKTTEKTTEETTKETTVSMERFEKKEAELQTAKDQAALATKNAQIAQANVQPAKKAEQFDIYKHVGLDPDDPDDVLSQSQVKLIDEYNRQQNKVQLDQVQFLVSHPDFNEIVGTQENLATGKYAPPLDKAIKENPALVGVIMNSPNLREAAYQIAKPYFDAAKTTKKSDKDDAAAAAQEIADAVANASNVKSPSNAPGGGVLSEEGRIAGLSEGDFIKLARENGASI